MKKYYCLLLIVNLIAATAMAQDEGAIVTKKRIEKSSSIYVSGGPALTFGKNIGDYSSGSSFEFGYMKRLNRVLSIGGSLSYTKFKYDPKKTSASTGGVSYVTNSDPNDWADTYGYADLTYDNGYILTLTGGDLSLTSLSFTLKINFIPINDNTKFSIYGFAKPFVASSVRKEVNGQGDRYTYEVYENSDQSDLTFTTDGLYYKDSSDPDIWGPNGNPPYPALAKTTTTTGGIYIGPGVEFNPTKQFSFFAQAGFGYTFPVNYVSTSSYTPTRESYLDEKFPIVKKGFPILNIQVGASFNF